MDNEKISLRRCSAALTAFFLGNSVITGAGSFAAPAGWIAILLASVLAIPYLLMLVRIKKLNSDSDFFAAVSSGIGKTFGGILIFLLICFSILMMSRDLAVFGEFVSANMMQYTPKLVIAALPALAAAITALGGESVSARWVELALPPVVIMIILALLLSVSGVQLNEISSGLHLPIEDMGKEIVYQLLSVFTAGLAATTLLYRSRDSREESGKDGKMVKQVLLSVGVAGLLLALVYFWNIALLGSEAIMLFNFATYHSMRVIEEGSLAQRIEALLTMPLVLLGFFRANIYLLFILRGIETIFPKLKKLKRVNVFIIAGIATALSVFLYSTPIQLWQRGVTIQWYSGFSYVIIPIIVWIGCEIKNRMKKV